MSPTARLLLGGAAPVPGDQTVVFGIMPATYINPSGAASIKPDLELNWLLNGLLRRGDEEMLTHYGLATTTRSSASV